MATKKVSLNKGEGTPVWVLVQPWLPTFYNSYLHLLELRLLLCACM